MTDSKWCRCDEPQFMGKYSYVHKYKNPEVSYGNKVKLEGINDILSCHEECLLCQNPWRKWNNIRGTELIDYPIGTVFGILNADYPIWVKLVRYRDILTMEQSGSYPAFTWKLAINESPVLLQDRFEIVEEE